MSHTDFLQIYSTLAAVVGGILALIIGTLKAKAYFDNKFSEMRRLLFGQLEIRDKAIRRLEYGAVRNWIGFQPGVDPPALRDADDLDKRQH